MNPRPLVIAHRGAPGHRPEHTLAGYRLAIAKGADFIEPDLVPTLDGHLVARHENEISGTTDVADHACFADRWATKTVDGVELTGWFTEDFTLSELKTLRATERLPELRPRNARYDGRFEVPTLEEILVLARRAGARRGRAIGVYPETKHPSYFAGLGLALEPRLVDTLRRHGLDSRVAPVLVQSFEADSLREVGERLPVRRVQLVDDVGAGLPLTDRALADVAAHADALGVAKTLVIPLTAEGRRCEPTDLVGRAHDLGLDVHVWTLRDENAFLAYDHRVGERPDRRGDGVGEALAFFDAGVDAVFSDYPGTAVEARRRWLAVAQPLAG